MNKDLILAAQSVPLDQKTEKAIAAFRHYEKAALTWDMFEPWYHVRTSFGKDSCVITWLAEQAGVPFKLYHSLTTLDPPELIRFGRQHYPQTITSKPARSLLSEMVSSKSQGPPTRLARWCCALYKEQGCKNQIKVLGVRAAESHNRAVNWRLWQPLRKDAWVLNPILYWTNADVWECILKNGIPYCSLYDEGFNRLGCIGCPMAGKGRVKEFARWPKYETAWKRAFAAFWLRWHGVPLQKPRWVSMEGKHLFLPITGERQERRYEKTRKRVEDGFWTLRRWYDLKGYETWQDLWAWWMEEESEPDDCGMGMA